MKSVFSFSLFGSNEKYWKGLYKNIEVIEEYFPSWWVYVWIGDNVPDHVIRYLEKKEKIRLINTNESGLINMSYRFFSIDDPDVQISIVRDADSRIYERDRACIEDFVASNKLFHIIRDHPNHHHPIMGGMWGIKKGVIQGTLYDLFQEWRKTHSHQQFWNDMDFLKRIFYPLIIPVAMIHDELQNYEPPEFRTPFRIALDNEKKHFIGQVYEFDEQGKEFPKFNYEKG